MVYIIEMKSKLHLYTSECVFIQRVSSTMFMVLFIGINSYETDFMQLLLMQNERKLSGFFNFTICYIGDRVFTAYSFDYHKRKSKNIRKYLNQCARGNGESITKRII